MREGDRRGRKASREERVKISALEAEIERLSESAARYKAIFEHSQDGINLARWNPETGEKVIVEMNPKYVELSGYPKAELLSGDIYSKQINEYTRQQEREQEKAWKRGETVRGRFSWVRPDGRENYIEFTSFPIRLNGGTYVLGIDRDITEQIRAEKALRESEQKYRQTVEKSPNPIFSVSRNGTILTWNEACRELLQYGEEMIGRDYREILWDPLSRPEIGAYVGRVFQGEAFSDVDVSYRRQDGGRRFVIARLYPIRHRQGRVQSCVITNSDITKRKQVEETLRRSEEKYRALYHNAVVGIFRTRVSDGLVLEANDLCVSLLGYESGEHFINKCRVSDHYVDKKDRDKLLERLNIEGEVRNFQTRFRRLDGVSFWAEFSAKCYPAEGYIEGAIIDISERKRAEEELSFLSSITEQVSDAIIVTDSDFKITYVNRAAEELYGYSIGELAGRKPMMFNVGPTADRIEEEISKTISAGKPWTGTLVNRKKSGDIFIVEIKVSPLRDKSGRIYSYVSIVHDVTIRKAAEEALRKSEEKFRRIVNQSLDGIVVCDEQGSIIEWNPGQEKITGIAREEAVGCPLWDILARLYPEGGEENKLLEKQKKSLIQSLGTGRITQLNRLVESEIQRPDGTRKLVQSAVFPIKADKGFMLCHMTRDVTEHKQLEEQLIQARKMEAIGTLAGGVAHDFNNLLVAILGYADLMMMSLEKKDKNHGFACEIEKSARQAAGLTNQLLGFARKGKFTLKSIDLNEAVRDAKKLLSRSLNKTVAINTNPQSDLWWIKGDPSQIQQIFMNLGVNAGDAMPEGGSLTIVTENVAADEDFCRDKPGMAAGRYVHIAVQDSGIGIPPENLPKIFDPFFTTKEVGRGTGLGLASVYGTVKSHEGHIYVSSAVNRGTVFDIYLPALSEPGRTDDDLKSELTGGDETILVVDDEEPVRNLARDILGKLGYQVITARDGIEALMIFQEKKRQIDLVLLDMFMPGMDGRCTYHNIRGVDPGVQVLLSSGFSRDEKIEAALDDGIKGFIKKPYGVDDLARAVRNVLDRN